MGRFASTVALYEELRPPYPAAFFRTVAEKLNLDREDALIDLGTGPGLLALGFAPYVGRITGVDPEPAMLEAAREAAGREGQALTLIEGRAEDLGDVGRFDVITIGRALHWMDERALGALFQRLVAPAGVIAICSSFSARDARNQWIETYSAARRAWSDERLWAESNRGERAHRDVAAVFAGTGFHTAEAIWVDTTHQVSVAHLARRMLTFSPSSPAALGPRVDAMLADVEARLKPFSRDGMISDVVTSVAQIVRRD